MKKLIFFIIIAIFLATTSCNSVQKGVEVVVKCCKAVSKTNKENNAEAEKVSDNTTLLPINAWDGKMLTW